MESNYDKQTARIINKAKSLGYTHIDINRYGYGIGRKGVWKVTAKGSNNVKVLIGLGATWNACYEDALEYLKVS